MRNLSFILAVLLFAGVAHAAPITTSQTTILPQTDNSFDLGTSTKAWRDLYVNRVCLQNDTCRTTWPTGGSGGSVAWGDITGTLSDQTDLQSALDAKLTATAFGANFYTFFNATTTDALTQGSTNKYWSNTLFDNRLSATTTLPNITTLSGLSLPYSQLTGTPTIPTKTSDLTNDSGFITNLSSFTTSDLAEGTNLYYTTTRFDNRLSATTSLPNITTLANLGTVKTSLTGVLKASSGVLSAASNGTDYTLITANTCSVGQHVSAITAAGVITCSSDTGSGGSGLATTSPISSGNILAYTGSGAGAAYGVATSSFTPSGEFTTTGTIGSFVGGANSTLALASNGVALTKLATVAANTVLGNNTGSTGNIVAFATSTLGIAISDTTGTLAVARGGTGQTTFTSGNLIYGNGTNALSSVATTSVSCSGSTTCTSFTAIGGSPITISSTATGSGLSTTSPLSAGNLLVYSATGAGSAFGVATNTLSGGTTGLTFSNSPSIIGSASSLSGTLAIANGGTGTTTAPSGQLLYGGAGAYQSVGTSTLSATSPLTGSFTQVGSSGSLGCQTASGSQAGCLSSADWTTFNSKLGSYDAFTHTSVWGQTTSATSTLLALTGSPYALVASSTSVFDNATTSKLTVSGTQWLPSLGTAAGAFLAVDPNGKVIATTTPAGGGTITGSGAAGQAAFWTSAGNISGDNGFFWDNTGKQLGIGTTTPGKLLHVYGNQSGGIALFERRTAGSAGNLLGTQIIAFSNTGADVDQTGPAQTFNYINSAGTSNVLAAVGAYRAGANNTGELAINSYNGGTPAEVARFRNNTLGTVGIGTTTPRGVLNIDSFSNSILYPQLIISNSAAGTDLKHWFASTTAATGDLQFGTINDTFTTVSPLFTLARSGNVGVGTTSPYALLSVNAPAGSAPYFAIGSSSSEVFSVKPNASAKLGIGTSSPGSILSVQGVGNFVASGLSTIYNGLKIVSELIIPSAANPTVSNSGDIALDTTTASTSIRANIGGTEQAFYTQQAGSFQLASSTAGLGGTTFASGTTTLGFWLPDRNTTVNSFSCRTDTGTLNVGIGTGTATTSDLAVSSTYSTLTPGSNNTFNLNQQIYFEIGTAASTPNLVMCTVRYTKNAE